MDFRRSTRLHSGLIDSDYYIRIENCDHSFDIAGSQRAPEKTLHLIHQRASQINGCGFCVDFGATEARRIGETEKRLVAVAAWRETSYFSEAERAALVLAEAMTRLSDRSDPVPDKIWEEVSKHYNQSELSGLVMWIAITNMFNRINVTTRQIAGEWSKSGVQEWVESGATVG
jgi:AhpD family alkylhydroperoxidase